MRTHTIVVHLSSLICLLALGCSSSSPSVPAAACAGGKCDGMVAAGPGSPDAAPSDSTTRVDAEPSEPVPFDAAVSSSPLDASTTTSDAMTSSSGISFVAAMPTGDRPYDFTTVTSSTFYAAN